jgi:peptidoglycan-associated lipoprotein
MSRAISYVIALGLLLTAAGCAKKAPAPPIAAAPLPAVEPAPPSPPPPVPPPSAPETPPMALSDDEIFARKTLDELNAEGLLGDVFFDLDRADLREDARAVLLRHAQWLSRWSSTRITVEGHCDERGTPEYNLALGERRAAAIRAYLTDLGVVPDRMLAVSKGKESPICIDQTEDCWQRNRRGHFVFTAK